MLEYGFNELDNDFVTLWSKKIVSGENTLIFEDLTKLAELGQINAIQSWYLLAKDNDNNAVIDSIVSNLGDGGANELLAIAHKDLFINDRWRQIAEWSELHSRGYFQRNDEEEERFLGLQHSIGNSKYGVYYKSAVEMYYNNYNQTLNPLSLERFYEMMTGRMSAIKSIITIDARTSVREFKKLRKTLLEMYNQDKNNVAVAFALGKNLTLFKSNEKLKALGSKILTDLSKRELSQTVKDYQVKGTKLLIKQQIEVRTQEQTAETQNMSAQDKRILEVAEGVRRAKEKYNITFDDVHRKYLSEEEYKKIMEDSKRAEDIKYEK